MSILNPLFEIVARVLIWIHAGLAVPFGAGSGLTWLLSIVILVVLMRLITLPLFIKQVKSQQRMMAHMPQMREIQKRYKHDKQRQQEEMMKFYRENGINPLGGCLPLVAQLPVFWSLFNVLRAIAEWKPGHIPQYGIPVPVVQSALHARVFGASLADKVMFTAPGQHVPVEAKIVILVFVVISAVTTFLTMRQSQKRGMMQQGPVDPDNPAANLQKYMIYIAPLFALSGLYWQFGLVIYWVMTNVWTLGQQHFLFRNLPPVDSATADAATAPATGAKGAAASKSSPAKSGTAKSGGVKSGGVKAGAAKPGGAKPGGGAKSAATAKKEGTGVKAAASAKGAVNGTETGGSSAKETVQGAAGGDGTRGPRRFGKGKAEPEPEPVTQTKIVRQQPVRQSRSKRSGKR